MVSRIGCLTLLILLFISSCQREVNFPNGSISSCGNPNGSYYFPTISTFVNGGFAVEQITGFAEDSTEGFLGNPLPITSSKTIISTKNGKILQTTFATLDWQYQLKDSGYIIAPMVVDPMGNIFAISSNNRLLSLSKDGVFRFEISLFTPNRFEYFHGLLATEKGIIIQNSHGYKGLFSFEGKKVWEQRDTSVRTPFQSFVENDILISLNVPYDETMQSYVETRTILNNTVLNKVYIPKSFEVVYSPIYFKESLLLLGKENGNTVCKRIAFNSKMIWENTSFPMQPKSMSVSDSGKIVVTLYEPGVAEYRSCVLMMNENGIVEWKKFFDNRIASPVYLSQNDMVFMGTSQYNSGLYFLENSGKFRGSVLLQQDIIAHLKLGITPYGEVVFGTQKTLRLFRTRK